MSRHKKTLHELAKNDPDFHDVRAKILLDAAQQIDQYAKETPFNVTHTPGLNEAVAELRRMASNARRAHKKVQDERRKAAKASDAKWEAFGAKS